MAVSLPQVAEEENVHPVFFGVIEDKLDKQKFVIQQKQIQLYSSHINFVCLLDLLVLKRDKSMCPS